MMKYQVGDLLTTEKDLYIVEGIKHLRYLVRNTETQRSWAWEIKYADGDKNLKKVN